MKTWIMTIGVVLVTAVSSFASSPIPYATDTFESALKGGETVVVSVHADWCPTCRTQTKILKELSTSGRTAKAVYLVVDFDGDKAAVARFKAQYQSTLVIFGHGVEVARSTGETDGNAIRSLIEKGL